MDPGTLTTILFIVLGIAIVIYIIAIIEVLTRNSDETPGSQRKEKKKPEKEEEEGWPQQEEETPPEKENE